MISGASVAQDALIAMMVMENAHHASIIFNLFKVTTEMLLVAASMELTSTVLLCSVVLAQLTAPHVLQTNNALLAVDIETIMA